MNQVLGFLLHHNISSFVYSILLVCHICFFQIQQYHCGLPQLHNVRLWYANITRTSKSLNPETTLQLFEPIMFYEDCHSNFHKQVIQPPSGIQLNFTMHSKLMLSLSMIPLFEWKVSTRNQSLSIIVGLLQATYTMGA